MSGTSGTGNRIGWAIVCGCALNAGIVCSQSFPTKSIRIITGATGSGLDTVARLIAQGISKNTAQQAIVENRAGSAVIPAQALLKAAPDGYTVLYYGNSIWLLPLLQEDVPYDAVKDFTPITLAISAPNILVVHPSLPSKSVKELIALAKAYPGQLNYASGISGSSNHLAAELFKVMGGVDIVRVSYKGTAAAFTDLISGRVQLMFPAAADPALSSFISSGKLRALAITSRTPSTSFPDVGTMDASGLPGYESEVRYAVLAPGNTPAPIVASLHREIVRTLTSDQAKEHFLRSGVTVVASSPGQLAAKMKEEIAKMEKVIKGAGIRIN